MATFTLLPWAPGLDDLVMPRADLWQTGSQRNSSDLGGTPFAVTPGTQPLTVQVNDGVAAFAGLRVTVTGGPTILALAPNPAALPRVDQIVLQVDPSTGAVSFAVVQGDPVNGPAPLGTGAAVQALIASVTLPAGTAPLTLVQQSWIAQAFGTARRQMHGADHHMSGGDPLNVFVDTGLPFFAWMGSGTPVRLVGTGAFPYTVPSGSVLAVAALGVTNQAQATVQVNAATVTLATNQQTSTTWCLALKPPSSCRRARQLRHVELGHRRALRAAASAAEHDAAGAGVGHGVSVERVYGSDRVVGGYHGSVRVRGCEWFRGHRRFTDDSNGAYAISMDVLHRLVLVDGGRGQPDGAKRRQARR